MISFKNIKISKALRVVVAVLLISTIALTQSTQNLYAATNSQREDVMKNSAEHDGDSTCIASTTTTTNDGTSGSNGPSGYESGLSGDFIVEQFAIHSLKALAATRGVPEADVLTEQHVIALVAFSLGEGGDINNRNIFNLLNHGPVKNDNSIDTGGDATSGFVRYETFDDGVDANARVLNGTYQQRVAKVLTDPNTTAAQVMEAWTYYTEYPGDKAWAGASEPGTRGSSADSYYQGRLKLIDTVVGKWETTAGLIIGTPALEQQIGAVKPSLLTYHPNGSTTTGAEDNPTGSSTGDTGGTDGTSGSSSTAVAPCSSFEESNLRAEKPAIDESKKDAFKGYGLIDSPTGVVLHWTGGDASRSVDQFISDIKSNTACGEGGCSVQFYIDGNGTIYQLVDSINTKTAHAAGFNDCCIGIEIGGTGSTDLLGNDTQKQSVVNLTAYLVDLYNMQIYPDVAAQKGILSHHITPQGIQNGKQDVGDEYHQQIVSAVKASTEESGANCPAGVSANAPYRKWCDELKKLLESSDKAKIEFAKQAAINSGSLIPESRATDFENIRIASSVKPDLEAMVKAAKEAGKNLEAVSGFRTFEDQALQRIEFCSDGQKDLTVDRIFVNSSAACSTAVLIPGTSKHNGGRAVDFGFNGLTDDPSFASTPEHQWLIANASKYGFSTISGEPWHWEAK